MISSPGLSLVNLSQISTSSSIWRCAASRMRRISRSAPSLTFAADVGLGTLGLELGKILARASADAAFRSMSR